MDLKEKLEYRAAEKAKLEKYRTITILIIMWPLTFILGWQFVLFALPVLTSELSHQDKILKLCYETGWLAIPIVACYYRIKVLNRSLGL